MQKTKKASRHASDLLDKIAEQTISVVVALVLGTALVGGGGYILLKHPSERLQYERKRQAYDDTVVSYRHFYDLLKSLGSGWFSNIDRQKSLDAALIALTTNAASPNIPEEQASSSVTQITQDLAQLGSERGRISGYFLADDFARSLQANIVLAYDAQIAATQQLQQLLFDWNRRTPQSRLESISVISDGFSDTASAMEAVVPKLEQLKDRTEIDRRNSDATAKELHSEVTALWIKMTLSFLGVFLGIALLSVVTLTALRPGRRNKP